MYIYHNSQNEKYRKPFGAVPTGSQVELSFEVWDGEVYEAFIRTWFDNQENYIPMEKRDNLYRGTVNIPDKKGLFWYYFVIRTNEGEFYYLNNDESLGGEGVLRRDNNMNSYQITVYDKNFHTPKWFRDSIMYQIFPDRFFHGTNTDYPKKREEYTVHEDWNERFTHNRHPYENGPACNDFYGGNLKGIEEKLPYLKELGISVIYLNPIFEAYSNHRYDTGNYKKIDMMLGTEEDFVSLTKKAKEMGINIILDGVFSHTGSDSIYFNKYGNYGDGGAYKDRNSEYRSWFQFKGDSNDYESWWGCTNLPNVNELSEGYLNYILRDEDAVIKKWLRLGAKGWRLDVADELPDEFIKILREEIKKTDEDAVIIGEVWEDASNKVSYSSLREYLTGDELDSVMNYPFKDAMIDFVIGNCNGTYFGKRILKILENYPKEVSYSLMNIAGTHDTMRIKTVMGQQGDGTDRDMNSRWDIKLRGEDESRAIRKQMLFAFMQMTFVGVPCIYYGDEIGMEGVADPFNRKPYPWGEGNNDLYEFYKKLTGIRNESPALRTGDFTVVYSDDRVFAYTRELKNNRDIFGEETQGKNYLCIVNTDKWDREIQVENVFCGKTEFNEIFGDKKHTLTDNKLNIKIMSESVMLLEY